MKSIVYTVEARCDNCDERHTFQSSKSNSLPLGWENIGVGDLKTIDLCPECSMKELVVDRYGWRVEE